ncbi:hypothetical protein JAAARDRAFT_714997 [Jaapia argillacea MUCL 33604]|uniref:Uncharacterized protein n=1 Tax=Jaapia argillacea MUCL 33604 TaxID=933084 RepID=A0A067PEE9_9AGAM|nr:hypothetical protein JAAARDRAFT_714997 [Jaapia argillacea MUCL 33604]
MRILTLATLLFATSVLANPIEKRAAAYYNPNINGGSELDNAGDGLGEPLNAGHQLLTRVIISGLSSSGVLNLNGLLNYAESLGYSEECFDIHLGGAQTANLGDGNGWTNQVIEIRQDYGSASVGTCLESLVGGNHFGAWQQNGSLASSGAWFLAVSEEEDVFEGHTIAPNGYNLGRNALVAAAVGSISYNGVTYTTTA